MESLARARVERLEDLVELDGRLHLSVSQPPAVLQTRALRRARGQLDVGLPEQCLLAQSRARVAVDWDVLVVKLDCGQRGVAAPRGEFLAADLAGRDAGHTHLRLQAELCGL